jgi:hypothetical protein
LRQCDAEASRTDRETCELQCRQRAEQPEAPIQHWKRTELKGGSPDPNVEGGSTTTTVERGPNGTTTTITTTDREGRTTVKRFAGTPQEQQAWIEGTGRVPFSVERRLQAWCWLGCSTRGTLAERTRCRTSCPRPSAVEPVRVQPAAPQAEAKPDPAACLAACTSARKRCHAACPSVGSDRATCALQCDQGEASCRTRC